MSKVLFCAANAASLLVLTITAAACGGGGEAPAPPSSTLSSAQASSSRTVPRAGMLTLAIEGRSNEDVSLASLGQDVVAVWSASTSDSTDIYAALSVDGGLSFMTPRRVNSTPGEARAGGEQPPRVVLVPQTGHTPDIVVVWAARGPTGTRLLMSGSRYGVNDFATSEIVPGTAAKGNRGWHSIALDEFGKPRALWLDHRNTPSQLWFGSLDGTVVAKSIGGGVCYCCKTSLVTEGPNVYAAWRHVFPGNQRDIAFTMSRDGGKTFSEIRRVSEDKWQFDGCPENGPALAVTDDGMIYTAWVTPEDGKAGAPLALYYAWSRDGINFSPRSQVKTSGAAGHVQLAARPDSGFEMVWDEVTSRGRRVHAMRQLRGGSILTIPRPLDDAEGLYPAVATTSNGTVVAWVKRGGPKTVIAVRTIP